MLGPVGRLRTTHSSSNSRDDRIGVVHKWVALDGFKPQAAVEDGSGQRLVIIYSYIYNIAWTAAHQILPILLLTSPQRWQQWAHNNQSTIDRLTLYICTYMREIIFTVLKK